MEINTNFDKPVEDWTEVDKQNFFINVDSLIRDSQKFMKHPYKKCLRTDCERLTRRAVCWYCSKKYNA